MSASKEEYSESYIRLAQLNLILNSHFETELTEKAVEKVLKQKGDLNYQIVPNAYFKAIQPGWIGYTGLHLAVEKQQLEIFQMLIKRGADFTLKNNNNETPLHQAMKFSKNTKIECWKLNGKLDHPYASAVLSAHVDRKTFGNPCNNFGLSHFHIACMTNNAKAVEYFLDNGVSVNGSIASDSTILPGFTPLHFAARYSALETVKVLLDYGADVHTTDIFEKSPMHILIERNIQIMDCINMAKRSNCSAFQTEFEVNKKIIKLLLEKHKIFSSSMVDNLGLSWIHVACALQDMSMLQRSISLSGMQKSSVNCDSPVWPGYSALHFASHFCLDAVKQLINRGADIMAQDTKGITPFDLCLQRYEAADMHYIIKNQSAWKRICLSNSKTRLADLVFAMRSHSDLKTFFQTSLPDLNVFIPLDSKLWPGYTPLHVAIIFKNRSKDVDDLYKDTDYLKDDCTPKLFNCPQAEQDIYLQRIRACLSSGADVTAKDSNGLTSLHHAFHLENENVINLLLKKHPKDINHADENGLTHLHIACAVDCNSLVKKLLGNGAEVNSVVRSRYTFKRNLATESSAVPYKLVISPGSTPLHIAVATGNKQLAEMLIKYGANISATDCYGLTPVHLTMIVRHILLTQYSVTRSDGVDLLHSKNLRDSVSNFGLSHLHVACQNNNLKAVKKLLELGANVTATISCNVDESSHLYGFQKPYDGYQPIHFAIESQNAEIVELLTKRGAHVLSRVANDSIPFYKSSITGIFNDFDETGFFRSMLSHDRSLLQRITKDTGVTALHIACQEVNVKAVEKLLQEGANPNGQAHMDSPIWPGCTPYHLLLCQCEDVNEDDVVTIIKLLVKHGADATLTNARQNTPLQEVFMGHYYFNEDTAPRILSLEGHKDFSVNPTNPHGISHFHLACFSGDLNAVESFIYMDVDCPPIDYFSKHHGGSSLLHSATILRNENVIDALLDNGFDDEVDARDSHGNTMLHVATRESMGFTCSKELLESLIEESGDVNAQNWIGQTALELLLKSRDSMSSEREASEAVELFLKRGSMVNIFNEITEEGYIGIMVSRAPGSLKSIQKHPFYKGVIRAPKRNRVDDMGRTPIHNIVSCGRSSKLSEIYASLIQGFIRVECDINHQDKKGRTALHDASKFKNTFAMVGLLMNGIDVNLLDLEGNSGFTYSLQPNENESRSDKSYILRKVSEHLYKLQLFELYVNKVNEEIGKKIPLTSEKIADITEDCKKEFDKMKGRKIEPHPIFLTDFLSETRIVSAFPDLPESQRRDVDTFFKTNSQQLLEDFPDLVGLLLLQYRKALARCAA